MSDHTTQAALELVFPIVVRVARELVYEGEGGFPETLEGYIIEDQKRLDGGASEYVRGIVETISDTFRVPGFDNDDADGKRQAIYKMLTAGPTRSWWVDGHHISATSVVTAASVAQAMYDYDAEVVRPWTDEDQAELEFQQAAGEATDK